METARSNSAAPSSQPSPAFINESVESMVGNDASSPPVRQFKGRTRYTVTDNLALVRLCVLYGDLYKRPVSKFWNTVSTEFTRQTGKPMADPLAKVAKMVKDREKLVEQQRLESGTVQEESDFTQALDSWRKIQERYDNEREEKQKTQKAKTKDAAIAETQAANMMRSFREKRRMGSSADDPDEDDTEDPEETSSTQSKSLARPRKRRQKDNTDTKELIGVVGSMGDKLSTAIEKGLTNMSDALRTSKVSEPDSSWMTRMNALEARNEETNVMVGKLLDLVQQMQPPPRPPPAAPPAPETSSRSTRSKK
jgi:hypothetical protein